jgi:hypothetical protein
MKLFFKVLITLVVSAFITFVFDVIMTINYSGSGGRVCINGGVDYAYPYSNRFYLDCISQSKATYLDLIQKWPILLGVLLVAYVLVGLLSRNFKDAQYIKKSVMMFLTIIAVWGLIAVYFFAKSN